MTPLDLEVIKERVRVGLTDHEFEAKLPTDLSDRWALIAEVERLREGISAVLVEEPALEVDPEGISYQVQVPWRDRLRDLLSPDTKEDR